VCVQLRDAQSQLERRDDKIRELTRMIELSHDNEARHAATARDLRRQIDEYQQRINGFPASGPAGLATADVSALYDRIRDLETRIRSVRSLL